MANAGQTTVFFDGFTTFREASLTLVCRKLYLAPIVYQGFLDKEVMEECYPQRDFHDLYIGQIVKVLVPEE